MISLTILGSEIWRGVMNMLPYIVGGIMFLGVILFFVTGGASLDRIDKNRDTNMDGKSIPPEDYK